MIEIHVILIFGFGIQSFDHDHSANILQQSSITINITINARPARLAPNSPFVLLPSCAPRAPPPSRRVKTRLLQAWPQSAPDLKVLYRRLSKSPLQPPLPELQRDKVSLVLLQLS